MRIVDAFKSFALSDTVEQSFNADYNLQ